MRGEPEKRSKLHGPPLQAREDSPRSLHHKNNRRGEGEFGQPKSDEGFAASLEGSKRSTRQPREARDPSRTNRDRRDEHTPAGRESPYSERRDAIAHWERASAVNRRRARD